MLRLHADRNRLAPSAEEWPVQLGMRGDPWRVAVACYLLNQTGAIQARPVLARLLALWPTPIDLGLATVDEVGDVVRRLGLGAVRSRNLVEMSFAFVFGEWRVMTDLRGFGAYASDAVRIFCLGDLTVEPEDRVLRVFVRAIR